jgi:hypothetical protein
MSIEQPLARIKVQHHASRLNDSLFFEEVLTSDYRALHEDHWMTSADSLDHLPDALGMRVAWSERTRHARVLLLVGDEGIVRAGLSHGGVAVEVAQAGEGDALMDHIRELLPRKTMRNGVPMTFWLWNPIRSMPATRSRFLEASIWEEVACNYPRSVAAHLSNLMDRFEPSKGGQLILWHGPPGTGKTHALKALGRAWEPWCSFEYVTDPERFFGQASYLIDVMLESLPTRKTGACLSSRTRANSSDPMHVTRWGRDCPAC